MASLSKPNARPLRGKGGFLASGGNAAVGLDSPPDTIDSSVTGH
jgi:hypothetical protein